MCPWKRKRPLLGSGVRYVAVSEDTERDLLLNLAATMANLLMERTRPVPKDELTGMTGIPVGHSETPSDPKLARLLPDFTKSGGESVKRENAPMRQLHESEIVESKLHSLHAIIDALEPAKSGQVSTPESNTHAQVAGINDLRIYLHVSMENLNGSIERIEQTDVMYQRLSYDQESLLDQLMGEQRIRAKPRKMQ